MFNNSSGVKCFLQEQEQQKSHNKLYQEYWGKK